MILDDEQTSYLFLQGFAFFRIDGDEAILIESEKKLCSTKRIR